eukprot:g75697.t1
MAKFTTIIHASLALANAAYQEQQVAFPLSRQLVTRAGERRRMAEETKQADVSAGFSLENIFSLRFLCTIGIGSQNQFAAVVPDISMDDVWINNRSVYQSNLSTTYVAVGTPWSSVMVDGTNVSGFLSKDTLALTGVLKVSEQIFSQVTFVKDGENGDSYDGRLGLGGLSAGTTGSPSFRANLLTQKKYYPDILSLRLRPTKTGSEIYFGPVQNGFAPSGISYFPSTNTSAWQVPVRSLFLGNEEIQLNVSARLETSFTAFVVNETTFNNIYQVLQKASRSCVLKGQYLIVCGGSPQVLPALSLTFGTDGADMTRFTLNPEEYVVESIVEFTVSKNIPENQMVIGTAFMQKYYTVLDNSKKEYTEGPRIGFARPAVPTPVKIQYGYGMIIPALIIILLIIGFSYVYCKYNNPRFPQSLAGVADRVRNWRRHNNGSVAPVHGPVGAIHTENERKAHWGNYRRQGSSPDTMDHEEQHIGDAHAPR